MDPERDEKSRQGHKGGGGGVAAQTTPQAVCSTWLTHVLPATAYRMDAGAGAGAQPRCLAKRDATRAERRAEEGEGPACVIHLLNEEEAEGPERVILAQGPC